VSSGELLTGEQYLESLRDGRQVYISGELVKDVTEHPAFRNAARSLARLYDSLHAPETAETLVGTDRGGLTTHRFFMPSYSVGELAAARDALEAWARLSYGFMGRTPDYKASFMATLGADPRHVRGPEQRGDAGEGQGRGLRAGVHRADGHAGQEARVPHVLRAGGHVALERAAVQPV
jgi:aromatic ring hydroxylase